MNDGAVGGSGGGSGAGRPGGRGEAPPLGRDRHRDVRGRGSQHLRAVVHQHGRIHPLVHELTARLRAHNRLAGTSTRIRATDLWQGTRDAVLSLFRRSAPDSAAPVGARLDDGVALVRSSAAPDDVRRALSGIWARELRELLRRDPACRTALAWLTAEIDDVFASGRAAVVLEQNNTARDSGTVFAVQHGDIHVARGVSGGTRQDPGDGPQ